ncbi:Holliday junction resolvase RuvX [Subdoligranulum sp. DSM 109015]|uniref:Putative pre-16S rRNA nuclease n=1 Tax=Gemmiger gallinarum TaxID=2779354 RepID=A0ABR9R5W7_9FIRM|nr:Holliday junction resolvase RuvX [Gemmiger gallinarum]MBE5038527.1 Holliday junction resolvase RuvX [Gemmiger gallinarum]
MKLIAVDYGEARTGLAECDPGELIVTPITPQIEEKSMNKAARAAADAALARGAGALVVGLPKNMDGTEGARAAKCRRFAARVADAAGLPVILWDERRTTVSAAAILSDNDVFGKKRKDRLDSVSAAVLLESHLAWRRQHPGENPPDVLMPSAPEAPSE